MQWDRELFPAVHITPSTSFRTTRFLPLIAPVMFICNYIMIFHWQRVDLSVVLLVRGDPHDVVEYRHGGFDFLLRRGPRPGRGLLPWGLEAFLDLGDLSPNAVELGARGLVSINSPSPGPVSCASGFAVRAGAPRCVATMRRG